jgi:hypothetical protein
LNNTRHSIRRVRDNKWNCWNYKHGICDDLQARVKKEISLTLINRTFVMGLLAVVEAEDASHVKDVYFVANALVVSHIMAVEHSRSTSVSEVTELSMVY